MMSGILPEIIEEAFHVNPQRRDPYYWIDGSLKS